MAGNRRKRIVVDARFVGSTGHGIARYVELLAQGLRSLALTYDLVFLIDPRQKAAIASSPISQFETFPCRARFLSPKEWNEIPRLLIQLRADLYHSPSFASLPRSPCSTIVTVHDLNHLHYGNLLQKVYYRGLLKPFLRRSQAVVSVSQTSAAELQDWLGPVGSKPIEVVPNAFERPPMEDEKSQQALLNRLGVKAGAFFFCVTNPKPHKNLELLSFAYLDVVQQLERNGEVPFPLVATVSKPDAPNRRVIATGGLSDRELSILYRSARATFSPSTYEGFGRPPVESLLAQTPSLVSDIAVHREILSGIAHPEVLFLPARSRDAWREAILDSQRKPKSLVSVETVNRLLGRFSIEKSALEMDRIYREALAATEPR